MSWQQEVIAIDGHWRALAHSGISTFLHVDILMMSKLGSMQLPAAMLAGRLQILISQLEACIWTVVMPRMAGRRFGRVAEKSTCI